MTTIKQASELVERLLQAELTGDQLDELRAEYREFADKYPITIALALKKITFGEVVRLEAEQAVATIMARPDIE